MNIKKRPEYYIFISNKMKELREKKPGLGNKEYMKLGAIAWQKYKEKNLIVKGLSKSKKASQKKKVDFLKN